MVNGVATRPVCLESPTRAPTESPTRSPAVGRGARQDVRVGASARVRALDALIGVGDKLTVVRPITWQDGRVGAAARVRALDARVGV